MLRITLHINAEQIGDYEVRNITRSTIPGSAWYEVRPIIDGREVGELICEVLHHRPDGAEALAATVLRRIAGRP